MSKLAEKIAKRLHDELGIDVEPIIERSYTQTFDAGEARFYMPLIDKGRVPDYVRFEERAHEIASAAALETYNPYANLPRGLDDQGITVLTKGDS